MTVFVRVRDSVTGHIYSVAETSVGDGQEVLDRLGTSDRSEPPVYKRALGDKPARGNRTRKRAAKKAASTTAPPADPSSTPETETS